MSPALIVAVILGGWVLAAVVVSLWLGKAINNADVQESAQEWQWGSRR